MASSKLAQKECVPEQRGRMAVLRFATLAFIGCLAATAGAEGKSCYDITSKRECENSMQDGHWCVWKCDVVGNRARASECACQIVRAIGFCFCAFLAAKTKNHWRVWP